MPVGIAFNLAGDLGHATELYVAELLARDVNVLIYAGTIDFICNWVANERWMLDLEWSGKEGFGKEELREWVVYGKVAGKTRSFGGFTFATVYGAGHMVCFPYFDAFWNGIDHDNPLRSPSINLQNRWK